MSDCNITKASFGNDTFSHFKIKMAIKQLKRNKAIIKDISLSTTNIDLTTEIYLIIDILMNEK